MAWLWSCSPVASSLPSDDLLRSARYQNPAEGDERCRTARTHTLPARMCPSLQLATSQVAAHAVVVKWKDRDVHGAAALLCIRLKVSNVFAANSERPGQRRPTGRRLPLFRHGDQAFALSLFPSSLARTSDGFRLLVLCSDGFSYALRRFISRKTPSRCIFFFGTLRA